MRFLLENPTSIPLYEKIWKNSVERFLKIDSSSCGVMLVNFQPRCA